MVNDRQSSKQAATESALKSEVIVFIGMLLIGVGEHRSEGRGPRFRGDDKEISCSVKRCPLADFVQREGVPAETFVQREEVPAETFVQREEVPAETFVQREEVPAFAGMTRRFCAVG
jgi:hypothetical protein